ncbi:MAG: HD-GYP domain-containing protein [Nitrospirae bacterium]|nr:HD-GYP domain-containing protein [Nitrospirota bacterium]
MRQRIPIDQLAVGMHVVGLDISWLRTPFLRSRWKVSDPSQIETLKACGARFVDVEVEQADESAQPSPEEETAKEDLKSESRSAGEECPTNPSGPKTSVEEELPRASETHRTVEVKPPQGRSAKAHHPTSPPVPPTSLDEELPQARETHTAAKNIIAKVMGDVRLGREINTEAAAQVVDNMIDSMLHNPDALISMSRLKSYDEYTFFHSVNTAILALGLGRHMGMSRDALYLLGLGVFLHDVGKMKVPLEILNKPDRLTNQEYEIIKQHALRGAELLTETKGLREAAIRPALEHHERINGTGYPFGRKQEELSLFGMIGAVTDIYDAITTDRVYHKAMPPHEALQYLYQVAQRGHVQAELVARFVRCIGVYPVGSCVRLNTNELGVVERLSHKRPLEPTLLLVRDAQETVIAPPRVLDLAVQTRKPIRTIAGVVLPAPYGIDPNLILDESIRSRPKSWVA